MALPKNSIGGNLVLQTGQEISSVAIAPPSDGSTDAATNGSLATTAAGLYQRTGGTWKALVENDNSAAGRFISASVVIGATSSSAQIALPTGASNGDRVVATYAEDPGGSAVGIIAVCAGGNLTVTTIGGNTGGTTTVVNCIIDTAT